MQVCRWSHWLRSWFAKDFVWFNFLNRSGEILLIFLSFEFRLWLHSFHRTCNTLISAHLVLCYYIILGCFSGWVKSRHNFSHRNLRNWTTRGTCRYGLLFLGCILDCLFSSCVHHGSLSSTKLRLGIIPLLSPLSCLEIKGLWDCIFRGLRIVLKNAFLNWRRSQFYPFCLRTFFDLKLLLLFIFINFPLSRGWKVFIKHIFEILIFGVDLTFNFSFKLVSDTLLQIFIKPILRRNTKLHRLLSLLCTLSWWFCNASEFPYWWMIS